ncbi:hypothetical protein TRFO_06771 [Tritrichomonas foetus]|uniref:Secretory carrier membrane protein n=1 Tax=Tritrichomonas foetus TaxID=1144522 RepID=A0A1J4JVT4_9EUKA|nr:hypothetical protein TRFO_06771 [Tritrichomonas foetus]|eukprot:OHT03123.1 hypothetical protein TRFO_06771 [Tritrichomonas foetus]
MSDNPFQNDADDEMPQFTKPTTTTTSASITSSVPAAGSSQYKLSKLEQLRAREAELLRRQQEIQGVRAEIVPEPNYPPFYPIIVYNPDTDIPTAAKSCVTFCLYGLMAMIAAAMFNVLAVLSVSGLPTYPKVRCFIFSIIQGFATVYVILHYSFEKLYSNCKKHDVPFMWTIIQFIIIGWLIYLTIGFPTSGSVGLATFLDLVAKSNSGFSIFMAFINMILTGAATGCQFLALMKAQAYQKISGHDDTDKLLHPADTP